MRKILFSLMAMALVVGLVGAGAFAYFSDVEKSTGNTMSAGTLDIQIGDNDEGYSNGPVTATFSSPANLAPNQTFTTGPVYLKNVGTIPIRWIFARFCNLSESDGVNTDAELALVTATDISRYIKLVSVFESNDGGTSYAQTDFDASLANAFLGYWNTRGAGFALDGEISLYDMVVARNYGSGDHVTTFVLLNAAPFPNPALPVGSVAAFKFTFQLLPSTPNNYQGDTATFEVDFIATQHDAYPDDELVETGLELLGA